MCQTFIMIQTGLLVFAKLVTIGAVNATQNFAGSIFAGITGTSESLIAIKAVQPIFDKFTQLPDFHKQPTAELNHFNQQLSIHNLSFGYDHRREILKQISLTIEKNHKYALIGDSGSGKTTLLNILAGKLTSYTGELMIDGLNYRDLDLSQVREQIYYLDQDPYIFNDSLRNNITLDDHIHNLDLDKIIDQTGLSKLVSRLPDGLDTILQYNGSDLSGGEKQRIVLARGLSSKRKIFLIDEGTSALDNRSRTEIEDLLTSDSQLTVVMVTHQLRKELEPKLDHIYKITAHS
ncbi:ATP-binding cassette domain-containing protein [Oenococcus sicerae]|nr:ATP-binding cassette domain-containing protein [Oenococcus sicerae]